MTEPSHPELLAELVTVMSAYEEVWNSQDFGALKAFWDTDDPEPLYLAEEQEDWRSGWPDVDRYFVANPGQPSFIEAILMRYTVSGVKPLTDDLVQVYGWVRHDMKLRGPMKPWGGDARVTAVLRRTGEGWRFVSYVEAHMTPLTYVQKLYELNVSPDFEDFRRSVVDGRPAD